MATELENRIIAEVERLFNQTGDNVFPKNLTTIGYGEYTVRQYMRLLADAGKLVRDGKKAGYRPLGTIPPIPRRPTTPTGSEVKRDLEAKIQQIEADIASLKRQLELVS